MSITNEKLQTIKDNVSKVYHSGQMDVIKNATSLKGFESNKAMLLDDVSPVTHEMGVKVRSKNMFEGTLNSGIYENENFKITIADSTKFKSMKIYLPVGTYTLASSVSLMLVREVVDGVYGSIAKSGNTYTFSVTVDGDVGFSFRRSDDADWDDSDNVWLNEGSTAAEYTPYVPDLTTVTVSRYGKNLTNSLTDINAEQNSFVISRDNGIVTLGSKNVITYSSMAHLYNKILSAGTYTFSFDCIIENIKNAQNQTMYTYM